MFGLKKKAEAAPVSAPLTIQSSASEVEGNLVFLSGNLEVLKFCPNGKVYVRGELVDRNQEIYAEFKRWLASTRN